MRQPTPEQEMIALRDHVASILAAGCPETTRLPERAWMLVHQALAAAALAQRQPAAPETTPAAAPALQRAA
jgi:hypothetical protein